MRKYLFTALLALFTLAACTKHDDSCIEEILKRLDNLESITEALDQKIIDGFLIKSVTPIPGTPGGWRIEFTGGSPSTIDILNGTNGTDGVTPQIEVRVTPNGSATLWVKTTGDWMDTGVNLTGPQGPQGDPGADAVAPKIEVRRNSDQTLTIWYNVTSGYPNDKWVDTGVNLDVTPSAGPILSMVNNEADGTVTLTLTDGMTVTGPYTFEKASAAVRFEIMTVGKPYDVGYTFQVKFIVNPSSASIPVGRATQGPENPLAKWEVNTVETVITARAGYVNPSTNFSIVGILPSEAGKGEFIATLQCEEEMLATKEYFIALVLNVNSEDDPILISSAPFGVKKLIIN